MPIHLTLEQLDELNRRKTDVNITYHGGWESDEDEFDYINGDITRKGVRIG